MKNHLFIGGAWDGYENAVEDHIERVPMPIVAGQGELGEQWYCRLVFSLPADGARWREFWIMALEGMTHGEIFERLLARYRRA